MSAGRSYTLPIGLEGHYGAWYGGDTGARMPAETPRPEVDTHAYRIFGLRLLSEIPLPLPQVTDVDDTYVDCVVRRAPMGAEPAPNGAVLATKYRVDGSVQCLRHTGGSGEWIWNRDVGTFYISEDGGEVVVYAERRADDRLLSMMILGQIAVFLLRKRGIPCLHASAVHTSKGTAGFLGVHGQGKSTMAACFLRRGAALLSDDVLPLRLRPEGTVAGPCLPIMKMWPETVTEALALSEPLPDIHDGLPKKLLMVGSRFPVLETPVRLDALYVLYRYDPVAAGRSDLEIRPLTPMEGMAILLSQTSWNTLHTPPEVAALLPLYSRLMSATPVRLLGYPNGFERQDALYEGIMHDLESL
jgi:hypothetical protein